VNHQERFDYQLQLPTEITIADVARVAGVSVSTVSRILNDKPDVAETTRQRVQQVIEQLGYTPHAQARGLAAGRSQTIALLYPLKTSFFSHLELDFVIGAAAAASEESFFFNFMTEPVTKSRLLSLYRSAQVDGVILMQIHLQDWRVNFLRDNNYPFVMIGRCADNDGLSFIDLDFEGAVITVFDYLVGLGHQHIAFINLSSAMHQQNFGPAVRSFAGYQKAKEKYGLPFLYREVNASTTDMFEATLQLLDEQPKLTAIFSKYSSISIGVIRALRQQGRTVPDDCSVVAIATDQVAQLMTPPLTTIDFPTNTVGYQAAKMLISKLKQEPIETNQILLPPQLIIRQSTTCEKEIDW
jgi:DNA-binding LacI/PurR family transcriptional regulator